MGIYSEFTVVFPLYEPYESGNLMEYFYFTNFKTYCLVRQDFVFLKTTVNQP